MKVSVGISNRHVHLKESDLKILFGDNYKLEKLKDLNQPKQYASTSTLTIKGPKGVIENVRVIGPTREYTQVEISVSDSYKLGINPPIRESGDVIDSAPITLIGPKGELNLEYGCIVADRHIHITPKQKELYGLTDNVDVYISREKETILLNVHLKVSDEAYFELHLDTDDANGCNLKNGDIVEIIEKR